MVDLLAKKDSYVPKFSVERGTSLLFPVGLAVFFLAAASIGGLMLLNRAQKEAREALVAEVQQKETDLRSDIVDQIFLLDQRLKNMRTLVTEHVFPTNVFRFLEVNTLATVKFASFNFDATSRKLDMTGGASTYAALSRQIGIFERDPQVQEVEFGGLSVSGNNDVGFKMSIIFKKSFLGLKL